MLEEEPGESAKKTKQYIPLLNEVQPQPEPKKGLTIQHFSKYVDHSVSDQEAEKNTLMDPQVLSWPETDRPAYARFKIKDSDIYVDVEIKGNIVVPKKCFVLIEPGKIRKILENEKVFMGMEHPETGAGIVIPLKHLSIGEEPIPLEFKLRERFLNKKSSHETKLREWIKALQTTLECIELEASRKTQQEDGQEEYQKPA